MVTVAWRAVAWAAGGAVAIYGVTAWSWGFGWVGDWFAEVRRFGGVNEVVNGSLMVNVLGWIGNLSDMGPSYMRSSDVEFRSNGTLLVRFRGERQGAEIGTCKMLTWNPPTEAAGFAEML